MNRPLNESTLDVKRRRRENWGMLDAGNSGSENGDARSLFRDKRTRHFANGDRVNEFQAFEQQATKRLRILLAATSIRDLMRLPSNHFEALGGDRAGQYSIRINRQWRLCFEWPSGATRPSNLEIIDYP